MKLHVFPGSTNCRKVLATAAYLNLDLEIENHDIKSGSTQSPEFLALNPNGKVPTLVDGDMVLWESNAILVYLATRQSGHELFPEAKRADILRWLFWEASHFNAASGTVGWEVIVKSMLGMGEPVQSLVESGSKDFHRYAPVLEQRLSDQRAFITGDTVSLADFSVGRHAGFFQINNDVMDALLAPYPYIKGWYQNLNEVAAWQASAPPWLK